VCASLGEESVNMKSVCVCITGRRVSTMKNLGVSITERRVIEHEEPRCVYHWEKSQ